MTKHSVTSEIRKLLYGVYYLDYARFEGPPTLIFAFIGYKFIRPSKKKQKVILQRLLLHLPKGARCLATCRPTSCANGEDAVL